MPILVRGVLVLFDGAVVSVPARFAAVANVFALVLVVAGIFFVVLVLFDVPVVSVPADVAPVANVSVLANV